MTTTRGTKRTLGGTPWLMALTMSSLGCGVFFGDGGGSGGGDPMDAEMDPDTSPDFDPPPEEEPFSGSCVPQGWARDDAADLPGVDVVLSLAGYDLQIDGDPYPTVERIDGPGFVANPGAELPLVAFVDAVVDDTHTGTLVISSAAIEFASGAFVHTGESRVRFAETGIVAEPLSSPGDDGVRPDLGPLADPGHADAVAASVRLELAPQAVQVTDYEVAYVIAEDGTRVDLDGPFTVTASATLRRNDTEIHAASLEGRWDGPTVIGLTPTDGEAQTSSEPLVARPSVTLGFDAHLRLSGDAVETLSPMRTRVAMDDMGAILASGVQLSSCEPDTLILYPGQTRALTMAYRQWGPPTDAVFSAVSAVDSDGRQWDSRVETTTDLPSELVSASEEHSDASWAQGFIDFVDAWRDLTQAIGRGAICVFTFGFVCPDGADNDDDGPPPLRAYPGWMTPYDVGEFELELTAPSEAGEYDVELTIEGDNYVATVPVHVLVWD